MRARNLAPRFGVTPKTIRDVWSGRTWIEATRHLWTDEEISTRDGEHAGKRKSTWASASGKQARRSASSSSSTNGSSSTSSEEDDEGAHKGAVTRDNGAKKPKIKDAVDVVDALAEYHCSISKPPTPTQKPAVSTGSGH